MSEKRRDNKNRILHNGEIQKADGRYRFKYQDINGRTSYVYSWRLDKNDPTPKGKPRDLSLREKEKQIEQDLFNQVVPNGGNLTVIQLVEKYVSLKTGVRQTTVTGYKTVINVLKKEPFGRIRIDKVKTSDAKAWLIKLQKKDGRGYSSIHSIRGVLRPAFEMALNDDLIRKNPFAFELSSVVVNDSVNREAITRKQERDLLKFIKEDAHFCRYYDAIYILFNTGMRISEFCGLTLDDLDMQKRTININKQLQRVGTTVYIEDSAKTNAGSRIIPMEDSVYDAFCKIIEKRKLNSANPVVDGFGNFLYLDKNNNPSLALHWEHYFQHAREKYNKIYKDELPLITPHVARHTYCSKKAKAGINPVHLAYLMGHAETDITLGTYTHTKFEDAVDELKRLGDIQDSEF